MQRIKVMNEGLPHHRDQSLSAKQSEPVADLSLQQIDVIVCSSFALIVDLV
jgi:hypothetical protein